MNNQGSEPSDLAIMDKQGKIQRYIQLGVLILAAGAIYPMIYLRQNYQTSMEEAFHISATQLGYLYSILGVFFFVCYLPSGWIADRFSPRKLISFSLAGTGLLGLWYATFPSFNQLLIIFCGWGITAGLTFWGSLIKQVNLLSREDEQGRFYGALDGGRGLIEAILATVAVSIFAYFAENNPSNNMEHGLKNVIYLYAITCIIVGLIILCFKDPAKSNQAQATKSDVSLWANLKELAVIKELWLMSIIIFCGYQQFWATYLFSGYMQEGGFGLTAVAAGFIVALKLWMRPLGGIGGGLLGDRFSNLSVLKVVLFISAISLFCLSFIGQGHSIYLLIFMVVFCGLITYIIRGIYWAILDICHIPNHVKGLAIGLVSIIGYLPDVFLPTVSGYLSDTYPGLIGYRIFFIYIGVMGLIGCGACVLLKSIVSKRKKYEIS
ncbi:MAG: MFS transporter [Burkholderiales bacterium]|nr:MFS transporter [Burkholderiales bacterium]